MLVLLRIVFTGLFIYCMLQARDDAPTAQGTDDLSVAFWLVIGVITGILCAATWAPFLGAKIADPLTGGWTDSQLDERKNYLLQMIRWFDKRHKAALVRWLCFIEGVRAPWLPTAFILGLKNAKPDSWLEKVYAREVWRFNHSENCVKAFEALQRHGIDPRPHHHNEVNIALVSRERRVTPDRPPMEVPPGPPAPKLERNERIRIGKQER